MNQNKVSQILFYIGIFIIGISLISGLIAGSLEIEYDSFNFGIFFYFTVVGFISGMIFIGLSEIIKLLHSINLKMGPNENEQKEAERHNAGMYHEGTWVVDGTDWDLAEEIGMNEEAELIDIIPTPYMRYGIVIVRKDETMIEKVLDFGGFKVEELNNQELIEKILAWYKDKRE